MQSGHHAVDLAGDGIQDGRHFGDVGEIKIGEDVLDRRVDVSVDVPDAEMLTDEVARADEAVSGQGSRTTFDRGGAPRPH